MKSVLRFLRGLFWLLKGLLGFLCRLLLVAWGACAIWWSNLPWLWLRAVIAVVFVVVAVKTLRFARSKQRGFVIFAAMFAAVVGWWMSIAPTHDRQWAPDVAVLPYAEINGDPVVIHDVRNFEYRSVDDFTPHYETREVLLSHLKSADLLISYFGGLGPVAHTFVSFIFDNAPPVCISIEARRRLGDHIRPLASMFKQYELIYVVGDERDLVRVRTNYRKENVYLYHFRVRPENVREMFLSYLDRINRLRETPEFYSLLSNNCTLNIHKKLAETHGPAPWDWAMLLNGWSARLAYNRGGVNTSMPFEELEKLSRINDRAVAADDDPQFSARIRDHLPEPAGL